MYPKVKFIKKDQKKDMFYFLGDMETFNKCKSSCGLIANGIIVDASGLILSPEIISSLAIEIWRLEKRLLNIKNSMYEKIGTDTEPVFDQIQRIKDFYSKHEIEVREHTGEDYNDGLSLRALHFETDDSMPKGKMKIIETVKPTVSLRGNIISHGEVVVVKSKET